MLLISCKVRNKNGCKLYSGILSPSRMTSCMKKKCNFAQES
ncbi:hypothetical protein HMPREF9441_03808 [Paraprevotella clara YIT 11840]|uniref:Uncharacterized protein n=1 Tax=Paraprevotella clara YIT 11840 TaxID=762968 RepID=G5SWN5_9BACT|nr:hypothetical protein HMPREF9441_03808 [Paraprevotella clara YIT 11840]